MFDEVDFQQKRLNAFVTITKDKAFENIKNILIIILLVVTTFIFTFDFVQTKAFENNPVSLKEKGSILAQEIEAYIPNEKNIIEIIVE